MLLFLNIRRLFIVQHKKFHRTHVRVEKSIFGHFVGLKVAPSIICKSKRNKTISFLGEAHTNIIFVPYNDHGLVVALQMSRMTSWTRWYRDQNVHDPKVGRLNYSSHEIQMSAIPVQSYFSFAMPMRTYKQIEREIFAVVGTDVTNIFKWNIATILHNFMHIHKICIFVF
ncbi:unnamed protein product [Xylocopa violacea]|uniref:Uncharacterized protein n=1 Tax=Xylocopa violacea TaxID=135666 RepID=A0ABP1N165_XYLVO